MASAGVNVIKEGDHVLLRKAGNLRLHQVHRKRDIWLDRIKFCLDGTIGHPFGTKFEVKNGQMVKLVRNKGQDPDKAQSGADAEKDNRFLLDSDSNQKLTAEEINQLKRKGVSGEKLIEQLIENSSTYEQKTDYAQEKWVKKKKKKHLREFTVLKPTSRLMCELYWSKGPTRICNLRVDSLAQILTLGNVKAGSTVMVVDTCLGLVTGAVLERLAGFGTVISFYHGDSPMRSLLDAYDFSQEVLDTLHYFPMEQVNSLKHLSSADIITLQDSVMKESPGPAEGEDCSGENTKMNNTSDSHLKQTDSTAPAPDEVTGSGVETKSSSSCVNGSPSNSQSGQTGSNQIQTGSETTDSQITRTGADHCAALLVNDAESINQPEQHKRSGKWKKKGSNKKTGVPKDRMVAKEERAKKISEARNILLQRNLDCLIVACKFHPSPIVTALLDLLAPSRQVVVFSQFQEALEDCYVGLREYGGVVNFRLSETWLREYQVLPNRTHPVIQMNGTGGYLLTATTIVKPQ